MPTRRPQKLDSELTPYLNNHVPWKTEIFDRLARIAQQERKGALDPTRQSLAILAWHNRLPSDEIGYIRGVDRAAPRVCANAAKPGDPAAP